MVMTVFLSIFCAVNNKYSYSHDGIMLINKAGQSKLAILVSSEKRGRLGESRSPLT